jgi:hypothetical protein
MLNHEKNGHPTVPSSGAPNIRFMRQRYGIKKDLNSMTLNKDSGFQITLKHSDTVRIGFQNIGGSLLTEINVRKIL